GIVKKIEIGGDAPVSIQTMWKEGITSVLKDSPLYNEDALVSILNRIEALSSLGCDIIRFAVPDIDSARALCLIAQYSKTPLVADIHFDYKLALECLKGNVAKIRINPGNIGSKEKTEAVVKACIEKGAAIRIGVNTGSFPKDIQAKVENGTMSRSEGLCETASRESDVLESLGFTNYCVSMKASSVQETIEANELFASRCSVPLHVGVTEAGPLIGGIVKSTIAFTHLLQKGIGNTIRVSLSDTPENEVITAREILYENGKRSGGVKIVSCPRCGRNGFDVHGFVNRWQTELLSMNKNITVAVMGCIVNGPGEGKHADIGITGAGDSIIIFKHGEIVRTLKTDESITDNEIKLNTLYSYADKAFREELESL
ncbi:MAG TPA: flavodoxin-dependent (E)-4-hydroxy-3-methylbut-2-enyl-diphosphate synthase, partial [Treponemataceae bacterium]|nr:flavodoxin-dependent (E)-4-hydroxy-3-methylbut-2-enyl-diphosphate synthase [Treponemataceae bacterium]